MISLLQLTRKSSTKIVKCILFLMILLSIILFVGHFGQGIAGILNTYRFYFLMGRWLMIACIYYYWNQMHLWLNHHFKWNLIFESDTQAIRNKVVLSLVLFELMIVERIPFLFIDLLKGFLA